MEDTKGCATKTGSGLGLDILQRRGFVYQGWRHRDVTVRILVDEVPFVCVWLAKSTCEPYPEALPASITEVAYECNVLAEIACPESSR